MTRPWGSGGVARLCLCLLHQVYMLFHAFDVSERMSDHLKDMVHCDTFDK